ncbi:phasin family protein [Massilia endophytica]|uniref:phasin family protein n=1 Tax=Massilia endophytica TaxID=2899220 RepID=UPI001E353FBE|nr:phasin family protein [Massilia endophytica]UGQ49030.1 phasin family protein [Massilia endophytica]
MAFFNDLSRSLMQTAQQYGELQLQFVHTMFEDSSATGQALMSVSRPTELFSITAAQAQPVAMRLRAYQQQLSRITADSQNGIIKVTGDHAEETTRTARELTDEVTRITSEETERTLRQQQDAIRQMANPLESIMDSAARHARAAMGEASDMAQQSVQAAQSAASKQPPRKEQHQPG